MESVLIQPNFPHRISLSQASQITGYHQDYLGLLCRLGKINASKIGRNWYTTQSELNKFMNPDDIGEEMGYVPESEGLVSESTTTLQDILQDTRDNIEEEEVRVSKPAAKVSIDAVVSSAPVIRVAMPTIVENTEITSLKSLPIRLIKKPAMPQHHTLQSLITRTKLEQLKKEVIELSGFMDSVSNELSEHRSILARHEAMLSARKDLSTAYVSNIDFGLNNEPKVSPKIIMIEDNKEVEQPNKAFWLWPSLAVGLVILISIAVLSQALPKTVDYAATIIYESTNSDAQSQVAGATDTIVTPEIQK